MKVVVVESPAKARTIANYLGRDHIVLASFGHVRDLEPKNGAVDPDNDFAMRWQVSARSSGHLKAITDALRKADSLVLATDPDREGEAIAWHLLEHLKTGRSLSKINTIERVTFNAITKATVLEAMAASREIDQSLVDAYLARRSLDYLVGFNLSPVLWRKLPGAKSAGRVQSVALRLITDRESQIETFDSREYWSISTLHSIAAKDGASARKITAQLVELDGKSLGKFGITNEAQAKELASDLDGIDGRIVDVTSKPEVRRPSAPFTTSTMQQEASRKLNLSARDTMSTAQRLYEGVQINGEGVGLITYMRTDAVTIGPEAVAACRKCIDFTYGKSYVPAKARSYKASARMTQEAHEAIRPTDLFRTPEDMAKYLRGADLELYRLIWKRTIASQMADARFTRTVIRFAAQKGAREYGMSATGSVQEFDGFLRVYQEGQDDPSSDTGYQGAGESAASEGSKGDQDVPLLPVVKVGESTSVTDVKPSQHYTKPPPRYTEASLIKEMEKVGIGRPSTYTTTLSVLRDREYVRLEKKRMIPAVRGRLVTAFLMRFFEQYVDYEFTANLESELDNIANGDKEWKLLMAEFWRRFSETVSAMDSQTITDVLEAISPSLQQFLFPLNDNGTRSDVCGACNDGRMSLRLGRYGAYLGCSNYPECRGVRQLDSSEASTADSAVDEELGVNPVTGAKVLLKHGRFGPYIEEEANQNPEPNKDEVPNATSAVAGVVGQDGLSDGTNSVEPVDSASKTTKAKKTTRQRKTSAAPPPKRCGLPKGLEPADVSLQVALRLLELPRTVGTHPDGETIVAQLGRYGPYITCGKTNVSLEEWSEVFSIQNNRAVSLIDDRRSGKFKRPGSKVEPLRVLGNHPTTGSEIAVFDGRFGPYVKADGINATIPRSESPDDITLESAVSLLDAKAAKGPVKRRSAKKAPAKKSPAKTTSAKKAPAKKAPAKTTSAKKTPAKKAPAKKAPAKKAPAKKAPTKKTSAAEAAES